MICRGIDILIVTREIYDSDLTHRAVAVFLYLCDRADRYGKCFPSMHTIADDLKFSRRTVVRALNDLEEEGFIRRENQYRTDGGNTSNLYLVKGVKLDV